MTDKLLELFMAAQRFDVDPQAALEAADRLARQRGDAVDDVAEALIEQFFAGVGLEAAVSALGAAT